jgi:hypothetical protein
VEARQRGGRGGPEGRRRQRERDGVAASGREGECGARVRRMRWRERRKAMQIQQTGIDRDWGSEGRQTRGGGGRTRDVGGGRAGSGEKKRSTMFLSQTSFFF